MAGYKPAAWEWWTPFACWPGPCDCTQEASIRWHTPLQEHCVSHPRLCVHWGAPWWCTSLLLGSVVPHLLAGLRPVPAHREDTSVGEEKQ